MRMDVDRLDLFAVDRDGPARRGRWSRRLRGRESAPAAAAERDASRGTAQELPACSAYVCLLHERPRRVVRSTRLDHRAFLMSMRQGNGADHGSWIFRTRECHVMTFTRLGPIGRMALVLFATLALARPAPAQTPSEVTVNVFPGGFNWGIYVAQERGLFEKNGIRVTVQATPGSVAQMTGLSEGKFDIAMTAVDNIVAYVEGQGEAPIGPQPEFFAFMGSDSGFLSLVSRPEIKRVPDFSGRTLSVDALTTGYAFVLLEILRRNGLERGGYDIRRVGGMVQRFNSLRDGNEDGTLLSAPYNILARDHGLRGLVKATAVLGPYQGNVAAAR